MWNVIIIPSRFVFELLLMMPDGEIMIVSVDAVNGINALDGIHSDNIMAYIYMYRAAGGVDYVYLASYRPALKNVDQQREYNPDIPDGITKNNFKMEGGWNGKTRLNAIGTALTASLSLTIKARPQDMQSYKCDFTYYVDDKFTENTKSFSKTATDKSPPGASCDNSEQCLNGLVCISSKCNCADVTTEYYDPDLRVCKLKDVTSNPYDSKPTSPSIGVTHCGDRKPCGSVATILAMNLEIISTVLVITQ